MYRRQHGHSCPHWEDYSYKDGLLDLIQTPSLAAGNLRITSSSTKPTFNMEYKFDSIGWTYMAIFIIWNLALAAGMAFLWINKDLPSLRMRRIPLLLAGVFLLHVYAALCIIVYPVGAAFSCTVEFWVMSLLVPLGIALFHAANSQFLHLASRQKHFASMTSLTESKTINEKEAQTIAHSRWRRIFTGVERADNIDRTLYCIGVGMAIQVRFFNPHYSTHLTRGNTAFSHNLRLLRIQKVSPRLRAFRLHSPRHRPRSTHELL